MMRVALCWIILTDSIALVEIDDLVDAFWKDKRRDHSHLVCPPGLSSSSDQCSSFRPMLTLVEIIVFKFLSFSTMI